VNDGLELSVPNLGNELVRVVSGVTDECISAGEVEQLDRFDNLVALPGC
jgi:hypothetical protein